MVFGIAFLYKFILVAALVFLSFVKLIVVSCFRSQRKLLRALGKVEESTKSSSIAPSTETTPRNVDDVGGSEADGAGVFKMPKLAPRSKVMMLLTISLMYTQRYRPEIPEPAPSLS